MRNSDPDWPASESEVWHLVEKQSGKPLDAAFRKNHKWEVQFVTEGGSVGQERLEMLIADAKRIRAPKQQANARRQRRTSGIEARAQALAAVIAMEARKDARLEYFRLAYLPDGLISREHIPNWLQSREDASRRSLTGTYLEYQLPNGAYKVVRAEDSPVLMYLKECADGLLRSTGWYQPQAVSFILTDQPPAYNLISESFTVYAENALLSRIRLSISLTVTPQELARHYAQIRAAMLGPSERVKAIKPSTCRKLQAYADAAGDWGQAFRTWMSAPEGRNTYLPNAAGQRTFKAHVQRAMRKLLGTSPDPAHRLSPLFSQMQEVAMGVTTGTREFEATPQAATPALARKRKTRSR